MVPEPRSSYALQFFLLAGMLLAAAGICSYSLIRLVPGNASGLPNRFSIAFAISTCLLLTGSGFMHCAIDAVRRERQAKFRRWLNRALAAGTLFVTTQIYALATLMRRQTPDETASGAATLVAVFASLHGMHFLIAFLFLCYVTVQANADRYDHEYYFGVTICTWFWHALGIAWLAILFAMMIARLYA